MSPGIRNSAYFGLDPHEEATAWVAFTHSNATNGALQVLPRTHLGPDLAHEETYAPDNMLARGLLLNIADESSAVTLELQPGEFSLHHERTAHGSKQNRSASPRIGFAFFYIPTHVRSTTGRRTATLVRGADRYGHWDPYLIRSPIRSGSLCGDARRLGSISRRRSQAGCGRVNAALRQAQSDAGRHQC